MVKRDFLSTLADWNGEGVLSLLGPTGSGKTRTAIEWVQRNFPQDLKHPLLVSVDSVAAFKELDIGSAKPQKVELENFAWAGVDLFPPTMTATVKDFLERVEHPIRQALSGRRPVLLVGGSFFYERALVDGMSPGESSDPVFLEGLSNKTNREIHELLISKDGRWSTKIHENDRYRLERYADLVLRQELSYDDLFEPREADSIISRSATACKTFVIGMDRERDDYSKLLASRIDEMFELGWVKEVHTIQNKYQGHSLPALGSVGYLQIVEGLSAGKSENEIRRDVLTSHLQLVKKQKTWLRGLLAKY